MLETPILDLESEPPAPRRTWLPKVIGVLVGLSITALLILIDQGKMPHWNLPGFNGLLIIPALYVAIAIHELGHLIAGKWAGFRTGGLAIGGFILVRSGRHWAFRFDRRAWMGGFFKPLTAAGEERIAPYAWMVAGGPMASVLLTLVCLVLVSRSGSGIWNSVGSLFWIALFTVLITAVPFSAGLNRSDGARLLLLWQHPERARSWMALIAVQTQEATGTRPRDWNSQQFERVLSTDRTASEYPYCQLMAFYRMLDEGAEDVALEHLENALRTSVSAGRPFRHLVFLEAASASAMLRNNTAAAQSWRERACKVRRPESLEAVNASICMCEGRYGEAAQLWQAAADRVDRRKLDSGLARFAKEKWAAYQAACRANA